MTPCWIFTFLDPSSFFLFVCVLYSPPPISLLCLFSICFSPSLFFYYLPISSRTSSSPFIFVLLFHMCSFSALIVLLRHLSSRSTLPQFSTEILHSSPPSQFLCYWLFHCSSLVISFLFFPVLQSTLLCSFCLPAVYLVIWRWGSSGPWLLPPPIGLVFVFLFVIIYIWLIFTYWVFVRVF
jgi:hypothetical protein